MFFVCLFEITSLVKKCLIDKENIPTKKIDITIDIIVETSDKSQPGAENCLASLLALSTEGRGGAIVHAEPARCSYE